MTRPSFQPSAKDRQQVEALTGLLVPQETIARFLDIDGKTLRKHFRAELDHGQEQTGAKLKAILYAAARQGSIRAATYLCDRMGLWPQPDVPAGQQTVQVIVRGGTAGLAPHLDVMPGAGDDMPPAA